MKIMVTGLFRAYRPGDSNQTHLFSSLRPAAATFLEKAVTPENAHRFLFMQNLLYLLVSVTSVRWPAGGCAVARNAVSPKT